MKMKSLGRLLSSSYVIVPCRVMTLVVPCSWGRGYGSVASICSVSAFLVVAFLVSMQHQIKQLEESRNRVEKYFLLLQKNGVQGARPQSISSSSSSSRSEWESGEDAILIYNRVPKTGSTSFVGIAYDLCEKNRFNVLHLNVSKNNHVLSLTDQMRFIDNITHWVAKKPALYHGHIAYLDFAKFGSVRRPVYINIVREPLDRLVSYYYFLRNGDDFRPHLKRRRAGNTESFDDCITRGGADCGEKDIWMQIPFFCGQAAECWSMGSEWALQMAKHNLVNNYLVVGVTEELGDFIRVLESLLPRFFLGAHRLYQHGNRSHLRRTSNKRPPSSATIQQLRKSIVWKLEQEFYDFAKQQFHFVRRRIVNSVASQPIRKRNTHPVFEKIRPR